MRAICFLLSLSSIAIERADKNPATKAFFLSSEQNLLMMQSTPLYNALRKAAKRANLTASKFYFTFTLFFTIRRYLNHSDDLFGILKKVKKY